MVPRGIASGCSVKKQTLALTLLFVITWPTFSEEGGTATVEALAMLQNIREAEEAASDEEEHSSSVVVVGESELSLLSLTNGNFDKAVASHRTLLVLFTDGSERSTALRSVLIKVARIVRDAKLAVVNGDDEIILAHRFKVNNLPGFRLFTKGQTLALPKTFKRSVEHIVSWVQVRSSMALPKWRKIEDTLVLDCKEHNMDAHLEAHPLVFVMFTKPSCVKCENLRPEWANVAKHMKGRMAIGRADASSRLGSRFSIKRLPTFTLFINKVPRFEYDGELNPVEMSRWAEGFEIGRKEDSVMELEADDFAGALESNPLILVQFYTPDSGAYKALYPEWVRAAHTLLESLPLARVDVDAEAKIVKDYGVDVTHVSDFPIVKLFRHGVMEDYVGGQSEKAVVSFAKRLLKKEAKKAKAAAAKEL